ncbi:four-helix bundle copper-binding protein [uncultured Marixanthomonas sp.]
MIEYCIKLCKSCTQECEKHEHSHCTKCAEACRACADACISHLS